MSAARGRAPERTKRIGLIGFGLIGRQVYQRLLADPGTLDAILREGAIRAANIANPIVDEAERLVGFLKV